MTASAVVPGSLGALGERLIYSTLLEPRYRTVPAFGDDCAAVGRDLVVTTDTCPAPLVASLGFDDPYYMGWLLATINLSDLAAAGAEPEGLVVNYTLPPDTPVAEFQRILDGVDQCAALHHTAVLGGDMRDGPTIHLSATAVGRCLPRRWHGVRSTGGRQSRRGARAGDRLVLVGSPGYLWGAALLFHEWAVLPDDDAAAVFERARLPVAQVRAGRILARRGLARASIDVSDGLFPSVRILCGANGLGATMHPELELDPVLEQICGQAKVNTFQLGQTWGDWSLLVAVRPGDVARTISMLRSEDIGAREIGRFTDAEGVLAVDGPTGPQAWEGTDQERFSASSWHGTHIASYLQRLRDDSA